MYVAVCQLELRISSAHSLKEKRQVVKSILNRLKNKNLSVAETGLQDFHQRAELGFAVVSNDKNVAENISRHMVDFIEDNYPVEIVSAQMEIH
jgi:uncharacterized protein YlxP (DUF503 family)